MNGKFEVTWRTLRTIAHSLMVHYRVLEAYINFALMYTTYQIFPVLHVAIVFADDDTWDSGTKDRKSVV